MSEAPKKAVQEQAQSAFAERMHAQCWEIRRYRQYVSEQENRWLTLEEAAREWIARYAGEFEQANARKP